MKLSNLAHSLLRDRAYHIEFNGYLTNHVKHAVVALGGLDASDSRIQEYWDEYTALTPYGFPLVPVEPPSSPVASIDDLLGRKEDFNGLFGYFEQRVEQDGLEAVVRDAAPRLLPGCAGALTHGVIHAGWGIAADSTPMAVEGLAYMAYTFIDSHPERFVTNHADTGGAFASLCGFSERWADVGGAEWAAATKADPKYADFHPELIQAGFQWQLAKVLEEGHPLLSEQPAWLETMAPAAALEELYKSVVLVYLATKNADGVGSFLVLHLITSLYAVEHVAASLPEAQVRAGLKCFWTVFKSLLATSDTVGVPSPERLRAEHSTIADAYDGEADAAKWQPIVKAAIAEEEEHNQKLAFVGRELWNRYGRWTAFRTAASTFTTTPAIGPGRKNASAQGSDAAHFNPVFTS